MDPRCILTAGVILRSSASMLASWSSSLSSAMLQGGVAAAAAAAVGAEPAGVAVLEGPIRIAPELQRGPLQCDLANRNAPFVEHDGRVGNVQLRQRDPWRLGANL